MKSDAINSLERDRALVQAMRLLGEPDEAIEEFLACLEMPEAQREELRQVTQPADVTTGGDVIEMNPLTSQPQRAKPR